jgi:F420H(2)-dependent quinone reductase
MLSMHPTLARMRCGSIAYSLHRTQMRDHSWHHPAIGRLADTYARVSPKLAHRPGATLPTRAHAWLLKRSKGRLGKRFLGAPVLVLRTTGRKSGEPREAPMFFVRHGDGWAVVASNAASKKPPAWFLNLEANPQAEVLQDGGEHPVTCRRATPDEERELWPRFVEVYRGYDHYKEIATRELPVVILERRA